MSSYFGFSKYSYVAIVDKPPVGLYQAGLQTNLLQSQQSDESHCCHSQHRQSHQQNQKRYLWNRVTRHDTSFQIHKKTTYVHRNLAMPIYHFLTIHRAHYRNHRLDYLVEVFHFSKLCQKTLMWVCKTFSIESKFQC